MIIQLASNDREFMALFFLTILLRASLVPAALIVCMWGMA